MEFVNAVCKSGVSYSFWYFLEMFVKMGSLILLGGFLRAKSMF